MYVRNTTASVSRPERELKGFAKVELEPGQSTTVIVSLDRRSLAYWDDQRHSWVAEAGEYEVEIGASSRNIRQRATVDLTATSAFGGPGKQQLVFTLESTLREILADDAAAAVLERYLPGSLKAGSWGWRWDSPSHSSPGSRRSSSQRTPCRPSSATCRLCAQTPSNTTAPTPLLARFRGGGVACLPATYPLYFLRSLVEQSRLHRTMQPPLPIRLSAATDKIRPAVIHWSVRLLLPATCNS